jgi:hypothetical protein
VYGGGIKRSRKKKLRNLDTTIEQVFALARGSLSNGDSTKGIADIVPSFGKAKGSSTLHPAESGHELTVLCGRGYKL